MEIRQRRMRAISRRIEWLDSRVRKSHVENRTVSYDEAELSALRWITTRIEELEHEVECLRNKLNMQF